MLGFLSGQVPPDPLVDGGINAKQSQLMILALISNRSHRSTGDWQELALIDKRSE